MTTKSNGKESMDIGFADDARRKSMNSHNLHALRAKRAYERRVQDDELERQARETQRRSVSYGRGRGRL